MYCQPSTTIQSQIDFILTKQKFSHIDQGHNRSFVRHKDVHDMNKHLCTGVYVWNYVRKSISTLFRNSSGSSETDIDQEVSVKQFFEKTNKNFADVSNAQAEKFSQVVHPGQHSERINVSFVSDVPVDKEVIDQIPIVKWIDEDCNLINKLRQKDQHRSSEIEGISHPYFYLGFTGAGFGAHFQEMHTMSFDVCLSGQARIVYAISMDCIPKFTAMMSYLETLARNYHAPCAAHPLQEKNLNFTDQFLKNNKIQFIKQVQIPGDIIITFPYGLHFGYYLGPTVNVASNHVYEHCLPYVHMSVCSWPCMVSSFKL